MTARTLSTFLILVYFCMLYFKCLSFMVSPVSLIGGLRITTYVVGLCTSMLGIFIDVCLEATSDISLHLSCLVALLPCPGLALIFSVLELDVRASDFARSYISFLAWLLGVTLQVYSICHGLSLFDKTE